jgi:hypothetical protein
MFRAAAHEGGTHVDEPEHVTVEIADPMGNKIKHFTGRYNQYGEEIWSATYHAYTGR